MNDIYSTKLTTFQDVPYLFYFSLARTVYSRAIHKDILAYNQSQADDRRDICELLAKEVQAALPDNENKLWHGAPVWFSDGNPIVGYTNRKNSVCLLFWSGQSFDEPSLEPEGNFKAAQKHYTSPEQIDTTELARWLKKAEDIQWDYKNLVKRKGELIRLK